MGFYCKLNLPQKVGRCDEAAVGSMLSKTIRQVAAEYLHNPSLLKQRATCTHDFERTHPLVAGHHDIIPQL